MQNRALGMKAEMLNPKPSGLRPAEIERLGRVAKTRFRLYYLHVLWSLVTIVVVLLAPLDAIEPIWPWLERLPAVVGILLPGLPEHLVEVGVKYPGTGFILVLVHVVLWGVNYGVKKAEHEHAFQAWQRTPTVVPNQLSSPIPKVGRFVKSTEWLALLIGTLVVVLVLLVVQDLCSASHAASNVGEPAVARVCTSKLCQLRTGEKVQVTISSNRARNETGVWLEKNALYAARYVGYNDWRDRKREVKPEGFRFEENWIGVPRFWWLEWMRPHRKGIWFQVVGRIERERNVFPILHAEDAKKLTVFKPTVSGELVLLVNDVIYRNNHGVMTIEICRCRGTQTTRSRCDDN